MTTTAPAWIGWLEADLHPYPTRPCSDAVVTIDISVRVDIVSVWLGSRTLAVLDRDALRDWVARPATRLAVDDLVFVLVDQQLCLHIDDAGPYALSVEAVRRLVEVLQP